MWAAERVARVNAETRPILDGALRHTHTHTRVETQTYMYKRIHIHELMYTYNNIR